MTICRALSPGSGNRPGGPIKTGIKSGGTWSWGTGGATGRSFGGRCFASRFMRIGNVCWSLPARIRSCTPIWVVVLGWDEQLRAARLERWLEAEALLEGYHGRGADELVHRALKDFASQTLPFKRFPANAAFYYTMLVAFFLYESFKQDVCDPVVPLSCYATTLRRRLLDVAGKIVRHAGQILLKVTTATWEQLQIRRLWEKSGNPPAFGWT